MLFLVNERKPPLSTTTVNHCLTTLNIMLNEAVWNDYLQTNPAESVRRLGTHHKEKTTLTYMEVKRLFNIQTVDRVWGGNIFNYTLNLLAAFTGMRMGEIQALQIGNIKKDHIRVEHSWSRKYGLKEPKYGSVREVPIPDYIYMNLEKVFSFHQSLDPEIILFSITEDNKPVGNSQITGAFYCALENIGITSTERKERNITFHSWRYFFNSLLSSNNIPDSKLRKLTGHKSEEMTNHYTKFNIENFRDVALVQDDFFKETNR